MKSLNEKIKQQTVKKGNCLIWIGASGDKTKTPTIIKNKKIFYVHKLLLKSDLRAKKSCATKLCVSPRCWKTIKTDKERLMFSLKKYKSCWIYSVRKTKRSNPNTKFRPKFYWNGKRTQASRASWEIFMGEIPDGMDVCHRCDNNKCVNPKHLFLGTHRDNVLDMVKKKRQNNNSKKQCKSGHNLSGENLKIYFLNGKFKQRICLICRKNRHRANNNLHLTLTTQKP